MKLFRRFYSEQFKKYSLAQLSLHNLLPIPLPLVRRLNRFVQTVAQPVVDFQNPTTPPAGTINLSWRMTSSPIRPDLFHWAVVYYRAGLRAGTAAAKNRGRVSGGGRKIYRQKGTGRARAGSSRAPQRRGGGVVFGPRPRDYSQQLPLKIRLRALFSALAMKHRDGLLKIVSESSIQLQSHKTKQLVPILNNHLPNGKKILLVDHGQFDRNIVLASRMLQDRLKLFDLSTLPELPCHAVLNSKLVLLTPRAVDHLVAHFK